MKIWLDYVEEDLNRMRVQEWKGLFRIEKKWRQIVMTVNFIVKCKKRKKEQQLCGYSAFISTLNCIIQQLSKNIKIQITNFEITKSAIKKINIIITFENIYYCCEIRSQIKTYRSQYFHNLYSQYYCNLFVMFIDTF